MLGNNLLPYNKGAWISIGDSAGCNGIVLVFANPAISMSVHCLNFDSADLGVGKLHLKLSI